MKINWIFLPDKLDSYLDLSLKKLKKTKKQMKNLKKKRSVKNKKSLDIYTSYSIPEILKILKYFKLKYNKLIQIPKKYKSKRLIEEFLRKHKIHNNTTVFTKFSFFEQRGGVQLGAFGREMTTLAQQQRNKVTSGNANINLNNSSNEGTNILSKKFRILEILKYKNEKKINLEDEDKIIKTHLEDITEKLKIIKSDKLEINKKKIKKIDEIKKTNTQEENYEVFLKAYYEYLGSKINEVFKADIKIKEILNKIWNDNNNSTKYEQGIKAIAEFLFDKINRKIEQIIKQPEKSKPIVEKKIFDTMPNFVNLLIIINKITEHDYITHLDDLQGNYKKYEQLKKRENINVQQLSVLEQQIKELENKLEKINAEIKKKNNKKSKRTTRSLDEARAKRDTCLQSIQRMWYNVYDKPSLEGTVNKFDNINDNRRYQTQNQKILDFYNILHNCKPFKETLVAGVLITSPQSRENYEITTPPVPNINDFF